MDNPNVNPWVQHRDFLNIHIPPATSATPVRSHSTVVKGTSTTLESLSFSTPNAWKTRPALHGACAFAPQHPLLLASVRMTFETPSELLGRAICSMAQCSPRRSSGRPPCANRLRILSTPLRRARPTPDPLKTPDESNSQRCAKHWDNFSNESTQKSQHNTTKHATQKKKRNKWKDNKGKEETDVRLHEARYSVCAGRGKGRGAVRGRGQDVTPLPRSSQNAQRVNLQWLAKLSSILVSMEFIKLTCSPNIQ